MALRTICVNTFRSVTDLGVNNARTFVTTGIAGISVQYYIVFMYRHYVTAFQHFHVRQVSTHYVTCSGKAP